MPRADTIVAELRSLLEQAEQGKISGFMWLASDGTSYQFGYLKMTEIERLRGAAVLCGLAVKPAICDDDGAAG